MRAHREPRVVALPGIILYARLSPERVCGLPEPDQIRPIVEPEKPANQLQGENMSEVSCGLSPTLNPRVIGWRAVISWNRFPPGKNGSSRNDGSPRYCARRLIPYGAEYPKGELNPPMLSKNMIPVPEVSADARRALNCAWDGKTLEPNGRPLRITRSRTGTAAMSAPHPAATGAPAKSSAR